MVNENSNFELPEFMPLDPPPCDNLNWTAKLVDQQWEFRKIMLERYMNTDDMDIGKIMEFYQWLTIQKLQAQEQNNEIGLLFQIAISSVMIHLLGHDKKCKHGIQFSRCACCEQQYTERFHVNRKLIEEEGTN